MNSPGVPAAFHSGQSQIAVVSIVFNCSCSHVAVVVERVHFVRWVAIRPSAATHCDKQLPTGDPAFPYDREPLHDHHLYTAMLEDLPIPAQTLVHSFLDNPHVLQQASKQLYDAANTTSCTTQWLQRWARQLVPAPRPLPYAVVTCRRLRNLQPHVLVQIILEVVQYSSSNSSACCSRNSSSSSSSSSRAIPAATTTSAPTTTTTSSSSSSSSSPPVDCARAAQLLRSGDWLAALRLLCPEPDQYLLPYLSLGGQAATIQHLLEQQAQQQEEDDKLNTKLQQQQQPATAAGEAAVLRHVVGEQQLLLAAQAAARAGHTRVLEVLLPSLSHRVTQPPLAGLQGQDPEEVIQMLANLPPHPLPWEVQGLVLEAACASGNLAAVHTCRRILGPSGYWTHYSLPAAAAAADPQVVAHLLQDLPHMGVVQQLAVALCAAGQLGRCAVLELLLHCEQVSKQPLKLAVEHAATQGWAGPALRQVLTRTLELFREDATALLTPAMTCALRASHHAVADEVWRALQQAVPVTTQYEGMMGALAAAGQLERVQWVLQECPYVLVRLGSAPARAALEHGHMEVAQLLMMHGDKPDNRRAAEMRGRVLAAVRQGAGEDLEEALGTLQQVMISDPDQALDLLLACRRVHGPCAMARILRHLQQQGESFGGILAAALTHGVAQGDLDLLQQLGRSCKADAAVVVGVVECCQRWATPQLMAWLLPWLQECGAADRRRRGPGRQQQLLQACFWRHLFKGSITGLEYLGEHIAPSGQGTAFSSALPAYAQLLHMLQEAEAVPCVLQWPQAPAALQHLYQQLLQTGCVDLVRAADVALHRCSSLVPIV